MGRVYHGADGVQDRAQLRIVLSHDLLVDFTVDHHPVHVRRHRRPHGVQRIRRIGDKFRDCVLFGLPFRQRPEVHLLHAAVRGKPDIIKLHFIKAQFYGPFGNFHQIVPHPGLVRVDPGQAVLIVKHGAVRVMQAPFGFCLSQERILKRHNPGNQVDPLFLTLLNQRRHILHIALYRPDLGNQGRIHLANHTAFVVFYVDYQGIQLRPVHQVDEGIHIGSARHRAGNINPLYLHPLFFRYFRLSFLRFLL